MAQTIKLLVVDDEANVVKLCRMILGKAGYTVLGATNSTEALQIITQDKPEIVILDVMMPDMSGVDLCHIIREQCGPRKPLIFMYTADTSKETHQNSINAGANAVITKETPIFELPTKMTPYLSQL